MGRQNSWDSCCDNGLAGSGSQWNKSVPWIFVVGLVRIELTTSALSVLRSNRLSYSPRGRLRLHHAFVRLHGGKLASSGQSRTAIDWLAVARSSPSCDHKKATPWA
jgi:hypothetical protein